MIYIRSQPEDYDHWAQLGNRGWSSEEVLPVFPQVGALGRPGRCGARKGGPLFTSRTRDQPACARRRSRPGSRWAGIPRDVNDLPHGTRRPCRLGAADPRRAAPRQHRADPISARRWGGPTCRWSPARWCTACCSTASVRPASNSPAAAPSNGPSGGRGHPSAGAIGSPHILQLSGVGDPDTSSALGVPAHHALRGVGRNFQDHFLVRVSCEVPGHRHDERDARAAWDFAGEVLRYVLTGKGMLTYAASLVAASVKVLQEFAIRRISRRCSPRPAMRPARRASWTPSRA